MLGGQGLGDDRGVVMLWLPAIVVLIGVNSLADDADCGGGLQLSCFPRPESGEGTFPEP